MMLQQLLAIGSWIGVSSMRSRVEVRLQRAVKSSGMIQQMVTSIYQILIFVSEISWAYVTM